MLKLLVAVSNKQYFCSTFGVVRIDRWILCKVILIAVLRCTFLQVELFQECFGRILLPETIDNSELTVGYTGNISLP